MPGKRPSRRKRRTREHVIADLSVNFVERHALLSGFTVQRIDRDYGIDLWITTHNQNGEIEAGDILVQLKATDHLNLIADGSLVAVRIRLDDYRLWLLEFYPVILIVYDAQTETGYWLHVQDHFTEMTDIDETRATMTVHIPRANIVDQSAMRKFASFRDAVFAQDKGRTK